MSLKDRGWYHTPAWRRMRQLALHRDKYLCQECLRQGKITPATEVHHIKPLEEYPELALNINNLESLCWECHEKTKRKPKDIPDGVRVIKMQPPYAES